MLKRLILAALLSSLLTGCIVATAPYHPGAVVRQAPPLRHEYPGYPPSAGHLWIGGNWAWAGQRHEWRPGHWSPPHAGHRRAPPPREYDRHRHGGPQARGDGWGGDRHDHRREDRREERREERRGWR